MWQPWTLAAWLEEHVGTGLARYVDSLFDLFILSPASAFQNP